MKRFLPALALFVLLVLPPLVAPTDTAQAQSGTYFNQRDDQYTLLGLKRAKDAYEAARADFERQEALFEKGLIAESERDQAFRNFSDAEVNYQQSLLSVLFEQQYVTVVRALKYQGSDGLSRVRLTLANASEGGGEFKKLINVDDELFRSLQPDIINDVYISLLNDEDAIVSRPYEAKIEQLRFGEPVTVTFALLQDLDAVSVSMIYGRGAQSSRKIYLEKDASINKVEIESEQFSQEVDLGSTASFTMSLELFGGLNTNYKLEVVNLPPEITYQFNDPSTQARLSQFKFTEGVNTRSAALQVFMPDRPTGEVAIDTPIPFFVLALPRDQAESLGDLRGRAMTLEEIEALNAGYVRLEVMPRGVGELLVRAQQLFHQVGKDETVDMHIEVVNEGSRRLDNVRVEVDPPLNWTKEIDPEVIRALDIGEEQRVRLRFTPPPDISEGRYEVRVRTTSLSDNQPVEAEDKTVTVEVQAEANWLAQLLLVLLIIGLVVGIMVFGIRLSRR